MKYLLSLLLSVSLCSPCTQTKGGKTVCATEESTGVSSNLTFYKQQNPPIRFRITPDSDTCTVTDADGTILAILYPDGKIDLRASPEKVIHVMADIIVMSATKYERQRWVDVLKEKHR